MQNDTIQAAIFWVLVVVISTAILALVSYTAMCAGNPASCLGI